MKISLKDKVEQSWREALKTWRNPAIPPVIAIESEKEREALGEVGSALEKQLAFMMYPHFQTYVNLGEINNRFPKDPERGLRAIVTHEIGHRFCPYDPITSLILDYDAKRNLRGSGITDRQQAAHLVLNLFADMCINTKKTKEGNKDIPWAYRQLNEKKKPSRLQKIYAKSMEIAWDKQLLPEKVKFDEEELADSWKLAKIFGREFFNRNHWREAIGEYARTIGPYISESELENEKKGKGLTLDDITRNMPEELDSKTLGELARRLSEVGKDNVPASESALEEFKDILAGFGQDNSLQASIAFYDNLARTYDVMFAEKPFGRPRSNPFQPKKWHPSMGAERLDVDYSILVGGRLIPGVNTYTWNTRKRERDAGMEEVVPTLDMYLDSSGSMPNPLETVSLPVLASFVAARKAHRKGAHIRATNFSGSKQYTQTDGATRNLQEVYEVLTRHHDGGTVFPTSALIEGPDPRQVLVITDTFLGNEDQTIEAIRKTREKDRRNKITIYALDKNADGTSLKKAGAEIIQGTSADIFKRTIGKADEVYTRT